MTTREQEALRAILGSAYHILTRQAWSCLAAFMFIISSCLKCFPVKSLSCDIPYPYGQSLTSFNFHSNIIFPVRPALAPQLKYKPIILHFTTYIPSLRTTSKCQHLSLTHILVYLLYCCPPRKLSLLWVRIFLFILFIRSPAPRTPDIQKMVKKYLLNE